MAMDVQMAVCRGTETMRALTEPEPQKHTELLALLALSFHLHSFLLLFSFQPCCAFPFFWPNWPKCAAAICCELGQGLFWWSVVWTWLRSDAASHWWRGLSGLFFNSFFEIGKAIPVGPGIIFYLRFPCQRQRRRWPNSQKKIHIGKSG